MPARFVERSLGQSIRFLRLTCRILHDRGKVAREVKVCAAPQQRAKRVYNANELGSEATDDLPSDTNGSGKRTNSFTVRMLTKIEALCAVAGSSEYRIGVNVFAHKTSFERPRPSLARLFLPDEDGSVLFLLSRVSVFILREELSHVPHRQI